MHRTSYKIAIIVFVLLVIPSLTCWMGGRIVELRNVSKELLLQGRFEQLRFLLLCYYQEHGSFPPTKYQANPNGPVHSWRVLLLPYIDVDSKTLYSNYNFSENWNSPDNLRIMHSLHPAANPFSMNDNDIANFLAIGDEDEWPSDKPLKSHLITKGKDRFLVIGYPDSKIRWTEPRY